MNQQTHDHGQMSLRDVAAELGKHPATIWRWVSAGVRGRTLPSYYVGGQLYVNREDLQVFIKTPKHRVDCETTAVGPPETERRAIDAELDAEGV